MARLLLLLAALVTLSLQTAFAQMPVGVQHTGEDALGRRLAFRLERLIEGDELYALAFAGTRFQLQIVTLDPGENETQTIASTTLVLTADSTLLPNYVSSMVSVAGADRIDTSARRLLGFLEKNLAELEEVRKSLVGDT